jgi:predicted RNA binding protein YcfA (HicA-like mRNA interferase family)
LKLARNLSGRELVHLLRRYGYEVVRHNGSHIRLQSSLKGHEHHLTVPDHSELRIGTLHKILQRAAAYLELEVSELTNELFGR